MNLHITPSFIIDRLCKTASVLLFLVPHLNDVFKLGTTCLFQDGNNVHNVSTDLGVRVQDVQDTPPFFTSPSYRRTILDKTAPVTLFGWY